MFEDAGKYDGAGHRVLMLAPTARDAAMARDILTHSGFVPEVFQSFDKLGLAMEKGAGVVILMEEFFATEEGMHFAELLGRQPKWSSLPLIVFASGKNQLSNGDFILKSLANIVLLERPVRILPLASAVKAALTARKRQYEIRDNMAEMKRSVEERDRLYAAAEAARADAETANRMKDEFLATLSHELRTPLNAILGWSRILKSGQIDADDLREGIATIERNSTAQAQIIEDLLDVSRIVSGNLKLEVQRVNIQEIVEAAIATAMPAANGKQIRVQKVLDSLAGPISGDPARIQQIVWNLVNNAVKFTPKGGRIQVLLERVNSHIEISVVDTGIGIRPEFLPRVFDRFRQADASTTRRHGGLGLGLAIVKQLVEMHGGVVRVKSPGEGQGSTFTVSLPVSIVHPEPLTVRNLSPPKNENTENLCQDGTLAGVRVLVLDDEADARQLMRRVLSKCEAEVALASSATEAFDLVETFLPDVIVSDVGMPDVDGYDFIRRVRAKRPSNVLPAAALTAFARAEDRKHALLAGFQTHLAKPVDPAELIAVVASLAGRTATS
jgi:signal transduction histidine kinase/CheY-like chemotaxis protein